MKFSLPTDKGQLLLYPEASVWPRKQDTSQTYGFSLFTHPTVGGYLEVYVCNFILFQGDPLTKQYKFQTFKNLLLNNTQQ